jgi:hypothetical protein
MGTGKFDRNGNEIKIGDKVRRNYSYEIRIKDGKPYAHNLDGSNWHLRMEDVGRDFTIIKP